MVTKPNQKIIQNGFSLFPFLFFIGFLYVPLVILFIQGTLNEGALNWENLYFPLRLSLLQAFASSLLSGLLGVALALLFLDSGIKASRILWPLSLLCFSLPVLIVSLSLISFWGKSGWLGKYFTGLEFYGWFGILMAHTFMNFGVFFRSAVESLNQDSRRLEKAALSLGSSRLNVFFHITLPKMLPSLKTSFLLVFTYCFTSFLAVLLLGGGPRFTTLEVMIYQAIRMELDLPMALVLSTVQLGFCAFLFFLMGRTQVVPISFQRTSFRLYGPRSGFGKVLNSIFLGGVLFLILGPLTSIVIDGFSAFPLILNLEMAHITFRGLGFAGLVSVTTVLLAGGTALIIVRFKNGILRKFLSVSYVFPLAFSSVVLSLAIFQTYGDFNFLQSSFVGPFLVQVLLSIPLATSYLLGGIKRIPREVREAASSLGASGWQKFFWIELPLLRKTLKLVFTLCLCLSLGEVSSFLMFGVGGEAVLPLWIFRQMGRYHFHEAAAGSLLLLLTYFPFFYFVGREEKIA